mgnify:CR=1 FL=1
MLFFRAASGLMPEFLSPPLSHAVRDVVTEEAAILPPRGAALHLTPLVSEGDLVAKGSPVACLRNAPDVCLVAPIAGRVARVARSASRRISEIVLFREDAGGTERRDVTASDSPNGLRRLMQSAGIWPWIRRRPFGGMPGADERPSAIVVIAADTDPDAVAPNVDLKGRHEAFARGIAALATLADGLVLVAWPDGEPKPDLDVTGTEIGWIACGPRHPQGAAGICIHRHAPAGTDAPVWDIHAEDVAELGDLLATGELPQRRLVRLSGAALGESRTVRTHPGADLRQLTQRIVNRSPHEVRTGSHLDGRPARWLGQRDRQVTVLPREALPEPVHWLRAALDNSNRADPAIPSAALSQAFGSALPAAPFIRALASGDEEAAIRFGVLSLLEEDISLADYVLGANGALKGQLRAMLDRIQSEYEG